MCRRLALDYHNLSLDKLNQDLKILLWIPKILEKTRFLEETWFLELSNKKRFMLCFIRLKAPFI